MQIFLNMFLILFSTFILGSQPWEIDSQTRESYNLILNSKVAQFENDRPKALAGTDLFAYNSNYNHEDCIYCQGHKQDRALEEKLTKINLVKKPSEHLQPLTGHCWGITLLLIKHHLANPYIDFRSEEFLFSVLNDPDFLENAHDLSASQVNSYLFTGGEIPPLNFFFQTIFNHYSITNNDFELFQINASLDRESLYATLRTLDNKLILLAFAENQFRHVIAISTDHNKLFIFDSNEGLVQYPDLENLSLFLNLILKKKNIKHLIVFSIQQ